MQRYTTHDIVDLLHSDTGEIVLHSDAQAEIARLQAEVEQLRGIGASAAMVCSAVAIVMGGVTKDTTLNEIVTALEKLKATARNDALEEAAELMESSWDEAIQGDLEHGVKSLNERAAFMFSRDYPLVSNLHGVAESIRALKTGDKC